MATGVSSSSSLEQNSFYQHLIEFDKNKNKMDGEQRSNTNENGTSEGSTRVKSTLFNGILPTSNGHDETDNEIDDGTTQLIELNNRIKNDFMSHCLSVLQDDEEARECVQIVWNKYLQSVGDAALMSAFFDTLPFSIKTNVLPKYQSEIMHWCQNLFHINSDALLCTSYYSESFQRVIRYALKIEHARGGLSSSGSKKAIIYVSADFDPNLKDDLSASLSNITFEYVRHDVSREDMIDVNRLEETIKRDSTSTESYPLMVIANAGTPFLGRCDDLRRIKAICDQNNVWLHVTGDLLGSLALLPSINHNVGISCDSLTLDIIKLLGIQNLPYLTFIVRSTPSSVPFKSTELSKTINEDEENNVDTNSSSASTTNTSVSESIINANISSLVSHPLYDIILHSPSINILSIWSVGQRCSNNHVLHHMKRSFELAAILIERLREVKTIRILDDDESGNNEEDTFKRICSGDAPTIRLPKIVVLFRFEFDEFEPTNQMNDIDAYIDLLNLWLFDKLVQQYPKMNLELLKSVHFQMAHSNHVHKQTIPAHAIRFAPLEHLLDIIDENDMQTFINDIQRFCDILLATMVARANLPITVSNYENLVAVQMPNWAGVGGVRFVPSSTDDQIEGAKSIVTPSTYCINTIQAELSRKLQTNDSAFSLGENVNEDGEPLFYLRLGMVRKREDLGVLLKKIADAGKETESSMKYVEDMAEKIKSGIRQAQKDLQAENEQLLMQDGLLRQLPLVAGLMSWWSPAPSSSPLATKGRSFDLNSGRIESTENTYIYRMQVKKQATHAPMHGEETTEVTNDNVEAAATTDISSESKAP